MTNREVYERDYEELEQYREIGTVEYFKKLKLADNGTIWGFIDEYVAYKNIGTVEECKKAVKEEDALKFYYCESEDDYYIGKRVGNFYYARYGETGFEWFMSRYLPWGEHVVEPNTLWKEHTYPSEPKEIPFFEWLQGFVKKYCGGTVEEIKSAKRYIDLKRKCGNPTNTIDLCAEYMEIGTVEECREAMKNQNANKPNYEKGQNQK